MSGRRDRPRRADLSQHFLRSDALAGRLVSETTISRRDLVVEIGAGRGALTAALAARCGRVVAVELDERLCADLELRFDGEPRVDVVRADFLRHELPTGRPYKVLGNVPFGRTAEIVRKVTSARRPPDDAYLILQLEAAQRFAGWPYGSESLWSLSLKPWWHIEIGRRLRRVDFDPPPRVDTAVLWLARRRRPLVEAVERERYLSWLRDGFGRRGSSVVACLRDRLTKRQLARLGRELSFDPSASPSELCFDQWLGLYRFWARFS